MAPKRAPVTGWERTDIGNVLLPGNYSVDLKYSGGTPLNIQKTASCVSNEASHPSVRTFCRKMYRIASGPLQVVENEAYMVAIDITQAPLNVSSSFRCAGMVKHVATRMRPARVTMSVPNSDFFRMQSCSAMQRRERQCQRQHCGMPELYGHMQPDMSARVRSHWYRPGDMQDTCRRNIVWIHRGVGQLDDYTQYQREDARLSNI
jgi:hypothetical protein